VESDISERYGVRDGSMSAGSDEQRHGPRSKAQGRPYTVHTDAGDSATAPCSADGTRVRRVRDHDRIPPRGFAHIGYHERSDPFRSVITRRRGGGSGGRRRRR
jgi:hypothetical protein